MALSFFLKASRVEPSAIQKAMIHSNTCPNKSAGKQASLLDKACLLTLNGSTYSNPSDSHTRTTSLNREILRYTKLNTTAIITLYVNNRSLRGGTPSRSFCDPGVKPNGLKLSGVSQYKSLASISSIGGPGTYMARRRFGLPE